MFTLSQSAIAANNGSIIFTKGQTRINGVKAKKKAPIKYGDVVSTSKSSLAIIKILPGTIIKLKANAKVVIEKPKKKKGKVNYSYVLKYGDMFIKAKSGKKRTYSVRSKNTVMGVRGTQFFVSSSKKKKNIWMCVNEGKVSVSFKGKPSKEVLVKAGQGVVINSNELPEVKQYDWTKKLNWKTKGSFKDVDDKTDIQNINYDLKNFNYD
jgi:ferric-dicitrate binding protein FerR (iron transport regulator)